MDGLEGWNVTAEAGFFASIDIESGGAEGTSPDYYLSGSGILADLEYLSLKSSIPSFRLKRLRVRFTAADGGTANINITGYKAGSMVPAATAFVTCSPFEAGVNEQWYTLDVSSNSSFNDIDEFRLYRSDGAGGAVGAKSIQVDAIEIEPVPPATATVTSVTRNSPQTTNASGVSFNVMFSSAVTGVSASSFSLSTAAGISGAHITSVSGFGNSYMVTAGTGSGDGSMGLTVNGAGISPVITNAPYTPGDSYIIDKTPPETTITGGPPALTNSSSAIFSLSSPSLDVAGYQYSLDGGAYTAVAAPLAFSGLPDGAHTLNVRAKDLAGNVDPTPAAHTWTIDLVPPSTPFVTYPLPGILLRDNTPVYSGTAEANSTVTIYVDNVTIGATTADAGGHWSMTQPSVLANGPHLVTVSSTDAAGNVSEKSLPCLIVINTANNAPVNLSVPSFTGPMVVGSQLTTTGNGTWSDEDGDLLTYTYQWYRADDNAGANAVAVSGANSGAYTITPFDAHKYMRLTVIANDGQGGTGQAGSAWLPVANSSPRAIVSPVVSGAARVGNTMSAGSGIWTDADGDLPAYTYQWYRADDNAGSNLAAISGATSNTYTLTSSDADKYVSVRVTASDGYGASAFSGSAPARVKLPVTVHISTTAASPVNGDFVADITFSEAVTGFSLADITVVNGAPGSLQTSDNITYTINVTPATPGLVALQVLPGVALSADLSGNTASNMLSVLYDDKPELTSVSIASANRISTGKAKAGDEVTLTFVSSAATMPPMVTIATHPVIAMNTGGNSWKATYTMSGSDAEGTVPFNISCTGIKGTTGTPATAATDGSSVIFDPAPPLISSVTASSADGVYKTGDVINIQVNFSEAVTVTGTPVLALNSGGSAVYSSGSGSSSLLFNYTVGAGDEADDLDYNSVSALSLAGGGIIDGAGNAAVPALPLPGAANSLAANKAIVIDGIAPSVTSVSVPANGTYKEGDNLDFIVSFSEPVNLSVSGGTPYIDLTIGSAPVHAVYNGSPSDGKASFRYTIKKDDLDLDGVVPGSSIVLNGGAITDQAGNNALTTLNNAGNTSGVLVDATKSHIATLAALSLSSGTLTPAFNAAITDYIASVPNSVGSITVVPATASNKASVSVNGRLVVSGQASGAISLDVGENVITTIVTAEDGTTTVTYTVRVTRDKFKPAITFADLTKTYGDADFDPGALSDNNKTAVTYTSSNTGVATIENGRIHITGAGTSVITASQASDATSYAADDVTRLLTVNKANLVVTADDKSRDYGQPNPPFSVRYSGFVKGETPAVLTAGASASAQATVTSAPGTYPVNVSGASAVNYSFSYVPGTLTVRPLHNAALSGLSIGKGTLSPSFSASVASYKVSLGYSDDRVAVVPVFDQTATARVNGLPAGNGTASFVPLNTGANTIEIAVTAQDGSTTQTYRVEVYRAVPPDAIVATNVLSPNGDGKNDYWIIKDIQLYPGNTVTVFDAAGRTVYSAKDYNNDWDGTFNRSPLAQGTYYYMIDLGNNIPRIKGYITILRNN